MDEPDKGVVTEVVPPATEPGETGEPLTPGEGAETKPEDLYQGKPINEHPRFREVYQQLKTFKDLGVTPEEIKKLVETARPAEKPAEQPLTERGKYLQQLKRELREVEPGLSLLDELRATHEEAAEAQYEEAYGTVDEFLKELNLPVNEKNNLLLQSLLAQAIDDDRILRAKYLRGDLSVLGKAMENVKTALFAPARRAGAAEVQKGKEKAGKLPVAPKGGSASLTKEKPPETLKEAAERAWEKFQEARETQE